VQPIAAVLENNFCVTGRLSALWSKKVILLSQGRRCQSSEGQAIDIVNWVVDWGCHPEANKEDRHFIGYNLE